MTRNGAHAQAAEPQWGPVLLRLARLLNFHIQLAAQLLFPISLWLLREPCTKRQFKFNRRRLSRFARRTTELNPIQSSAGARSLPMCENTTSHALILHDSGTTALEVVVGVTLRPPERLHGESQEHAHAKIKLSDHMTGPLSFSQALATPTPASQKMRLGRPR